MNSKKEWFSTFRYVVPADFEKFMEKNALEGWNIDKIGQWSSLMMVFRKTEPRKYRYVFDINTAPSNDYKVTYESFGWEFVGQMASCFIWRKEYENDRPEAFTDNDSMQKRNIRVKNAVMIPAFMFTITWIILISVLLLNLKNLVMWDIVQFVIGITLVTVFSSYFWWVVCKLKSNIFLR